MQYFGSDAVDVHRFLMLGICAVATAYSLISFTPTVLYTLKIPDQIPYILGRSLCHQTPSRCLWFFDAHTALCSKCSGMYLASAFVAFVSFRNPHILHRKWLVMAGSAAFATTCVHSFSQEFWGQMPVTPLEGFLMGVLSAVGFVGVVNLLYFSKRGWGVSMLRRNLKAGLVACVLLHMIGFAGVVFAQNGENGKSVLVPAGTPVILEVMSGITAKETREGDTIMLRVRVPVRVKDYLVINGGAMARGLVTLSRSASSWGGAGEIQIDARSVNAVDGSEILIGGTAGRRGETSHGASSAVAVGGAIICLPLGLAGAAVKGEEGEIRTGYEIVGRTLGDAVVRILSEEERIQIQQQQVRESDAMYQRAQEERQKREEEARRKKHDQQSSTNR